MMPNLDCNTLTLDVSPLMPVSPAEATDAGSSPRAAHYVGKRLLDILISGLLLVGLLPLLAAVALGVVLTSRGPAFYAQWRVGREGRPFRMHKFRSMYVKACTAQPVVQNGELLKVKKDPRVTKIGRWIRRTSVDELPQLWDVFRGEMSIIGPRPLPANMLLAAPHLLAERARVRPGITGLWQIRNRKNNRSIDDMLCHDLEYVSEISPRTDWRIALHTFSAVVKGHGAF